MTGRFTLARLRSNCNLLVALSLLSGCSTAVGTVRSRAAFDFECTESEVEVANITGTSYSASGCGHEGTYTCSRSAQSGVTNEIICVSDDTPQTAAKAFSGEQKQKSQPSEAAVAPAAPATDAPVGAVGFEFGMTEEGAKEVCEKAGNSWTKLDQQHSECSGAPVALAFNAVARVRFCSKKICVIQLAIEPEAKDGLATAFKTAYAGLHSKYGPKTSGSLMLVPACAGIAFRDCIVDEQVKIDLNWRWRTGESIALFSGPSRIGPEGPPGLYLYYVSMRSKLKTQGL